MATFGRQDDQLYQDAELAQFYDLQNGWAAASRIRFTGQAVLAALVEAAGIAVERWYGDWSGAPWHPAAKEIISLGRLK